LTDPRAEYQARVSQGDEAIARGDRRHVLVSNLRLATAGAAALVAWLAFGPNALSPAWLVVPALVFLALVAIHARVLQRNERAARARRIYLRGLDRLDGHWAGAGPDGARFLESHPYARDLDLFGPGSLFQLLDTARTEAGQDTLAEWLRGPAPIDDVRARQAAVAELAPLVDFREDLAVLAAEAHVGRTGALVEWAAAAPAGLTGAIAGLFAACAGVTVVLLPLGFAGRIASPIVFLWLALQTLVALWWRTRVALVLGRIDTPAYDLGLIVELIQRIERQPFSSPRLAGIRQTLFQGHASPSSLIRGLRRYVAAVDATQNQLFRPIAPLLLVRSQAAVAIDRWHAANRTALDAWLRAVGDLEALSSLATHAYEHPADPFPDLQEGGPVFRAEGLAHPLLVESSAVRNDVAVGGAGPRVLIVSGSNMSGKSTLLRAVGVNVVLALAGGPVRAVRLTMSPLVVGATIRVEDSLQEGHSRFYTEILRIRDIVEAARGPRPLVFLLDEILHGTNSHDRRIGAEAIIRTLVDLGAIGLVTTHDLALTELPSALGARLANVHFEDEMVDGRLVFDYRMRPGVVEHSNALALMRAVGLRVDGEQALGTLQSPR
jgi:hypothetical protein